MSAFSDIPKTFRAVTAASGRMNNDRRFPGVKGRAPYHITLRREVASQGAASRAARTPEQQLAELDRRLGVGMGAKRERSRLRGLR